MDFEQVIAAVSATLQTQCDRPLSNLEIELLRGAWDELTYDEIAAASGYSLNYLQRDFGPKFWRLLSQIYGCRLTKTSARTVLTQKAEKGTGGVGSKGVGGAGAATSLDSKLQNLKSAADPSPPTHPPIHPSTHPPRQPPSPQRPSHPPTHPITPPPTPAPAPVGARLPMFAPSMAAPKNWLPWAGGWWMPSVV